MDLQLYGRNIADDKRWITVAMARTLGKNEVTNEQLVLDITDDA